MSQHAPAAPAADRAPEPPGQTLGVLLSRARARSGLSHAQAMRTLRRRLRRRVNRWTGALVEPWETDAGDLDPWLLVEYLDALDAPLDTWLELLESLLVEDGDAASTSQDIRRCFEAASAERRGEILAVLRAWVRSEAEMERCPRQMNAIAKQVAALFANALPPQPASAAPTLLGASTCPRAC